MMAALNDSAISSAAGLALAPNSTIEIRREDTGALAALFSDEAGTMGLANPFTTDAFGRFTAYMAGIDRGYSVKATFGAEVLTIHNVAVGTAAQLDATTVGKALIQAADAPAGRDALELDSHDILLNSLYGIA